MHNHVEDKNSKVILLAILIVFVGYIYFSGSYQQLKFHNIQNNLSDIIAFHQRSPILMTSAFFGIYVLITSLSIPGAIVLTLLSGAVFGVLPGTFIVSLASTVGATIAFLLSRYIFRDSVMHRFSNKFREIDDKFIDKGTMYLFSLRMIPVSPFVLINLLMGMTSIKLWSYVWITFLGMMPGTLVYVYAGRRISQISSPAEILTWPIVLLLTFLGLMPLMLKILTKKIP